jgi:hypothetical protein
VLPRDLEWWRGRPGAADWLDRLPLLASDVRMVHALAWGLGESVYEDLVACARWISLAG